MKVFGAPGDTVTPAKPLTPVGTSCGGEDPPYGVEQGDAGGVGAPAATPAAKVTE